MEQLTLHDSFILKPIQSVLEEGLLAMSGINHGIEVYPLYEYLFQSVFLKMTGFQEQKLKLIHWTLATYDNDFRWDYTQNHSKKYYSTYDDKNSVLQDLFKLMTKHHSDIESIETIESLIVLQIGDEEKKNIIQKVYDKLKDGKNNYYKDLIGAWLLSEDNFNCTGNDNEIILNKFNMELKNKLGVTPTHDWNYHRERVTILLCLFGTGCFNKDKDNINEIFSHYPKSDNDYCKLKQQLKIQIERVVFNEAPTNNLILERIKDVSNKVISSKTTKGELRQYFFNKIKIKLIESISHIPFFDGVKQIELSDFEFLILSNEGKSEVIINLFGKEFKEKYFDSLYTHRNRCAHNTLSYQKNLPALEILANENYQFDNYYVRFLILILIDEIFIMLFKKYREIVLSEVNF